MRMKQYGVMLILALLITSFARFSAGAQAEIQAEYCYQYGDSESLMVAKEISYAMALRKAIETYQTFVASTSVVEDFQLRKDLVETIVSGYVQRIKIVRQDIEGRKVCTELVGYVDPQTVRRIISKQVKLVSQKRDQEFAGIISNVYLKILNYKLYTDSGGNKHLNLFYQIKQSPPLGGVRMAVFCFDQYGNPVQTSFCDIVASSSFEGAFGEQTCVLPSQAVSINIRF